jgi:cytochrome c
MKKLILAVIVIASVVFTSCKGEKKADKATEAVKETVKEVKETVEETTKEVAKEAEAAKDAVTKNLTDQEKAGQALIQGKGGCVACHKDDAKFVGPSYKEVAKVYSEKKGNLVKFLKGGADAIVDPPQFAVMKPNLEITKKMSGDELASIAAYIRSLE